MRGADAAGRRIERDLGAGFDGLGEPDLDARLVDRRGGEDARARRRAADFGHRQPGLARERRGRIEPEAPTADTEPVGAGRIAAFGDAVWEGQCDAPPNSFVPSEVEGRM